MQDIQHNLKALAAKIGEAQAKLNIADDKAELSGLQQQTARTDFWDDPKQAAATSQRLADLERHVTSWETLAADVADALELATLSDGDSAAELQALYERLSQEYARREFELKLSGPYDAGSAIMTIYAGTGGTDAQDWA